MPTFDIVSASGRHPITAEQDVAATAAYLLGSGQYELWGDGDLPVIPVIHHMPSPMSVLRDTYGVDANAIIKTRRAELCAALDTVRPAESTIGTNAQRLAAQLRKVGAHA